MNTIRDLIKEHRHNRWLHGAANLWRGPVRNREEDILELKLVLIGTVITIILPAAFLIVMRHLPEECRLAIGQSSVIYIIVAILIMFFLWFVVKAFDVLSKFVMDFIVFEQLSANPLKFWEFDFLDLRSERKRKRKYFLETKKLAETGSVDDMCELGRLYRDGEGCRKDRKKAHLWFDRAYQNGLPIAGFMDGLLMKR